MYEIRDLSKIHEYGKELITEELSGRKNIVDCIW